MPLPFRLPDLNSIKNTFMLGVAIMGLEHQLFTSLAKVSPDDVYNAIEADKYWTIPDDLLQWGRPLYRRFYNTFQTYTAEYLLDRLRVKRPELYSVITTHPTGKQWLRTRLAEVKKQLEG